MNFESTIQGYGDNDILCTTKIQNLLSVRGAKGVVLGDN